VNEIERARIIHDGQETLSKIAKGSELTLGHRCRLGARRRHRPQDVQKSVCLGLFTQTDFGSHPPDFGFFLSAERGVCQLDGDFL
jgi:hypothetical protein